MLRVEHSSIHTYSFRVFIPLLMSAGPFTALYHHKTTIQFASRKPLVYPIEDANVLSAPLLWLPLIKGTLSLAFPRESEDQQTLVVRTTYTTDTRHIILYCRCICLNAYLAHPRFIFSIFLYVCMYVCIYVCMHVCLLTETFRFTKSYKYGIIFHKNEK